MAHYLKHHDIRSFVTNRSFVTGYENEWVTEPNNDMGTWPCLSPITKRRNNNGLPSQPTDNKYSSHNPGMIPEAQTMHKEYHEHVQFSHANSRSWFHNGVTLRLHPCTPAPLPPGCSRNFYTRQRYTTDQNAFYAGVFERMTSN